MTEAEDPVSTTPASLAEALTLARGSEADSFLQGSLHNFDGRTYGGQLVAQAVAAAQSTVDRDRAAHSTHGYFLSAGSLDSPIEYHVERLRDGRTFSSRRVDARQNGRLVYSATVSFQVPDVGFAHQIDLPKGVPSPDEVPASGKFVTPDGGPANCETVMEVREIPADMWPEEETVHSAAWLRVREPLGDNPNLHRAAVAYLSDAVLQFPMFEGIGASWDDARNMAFASLDHAVWWHEDCRADEWLLAVQRSPKSHGGRGIAIGAIYDRAGNLVASKAQEMMLRLQGRPTTGG